MVIANAAPTLSRHIPRAHDARSGTSRRPQLAAISYSLQLQADVAEHFRRSGTSRRPQLAAISS
jgi:hypothetical protein